MGSRVDVNPELLLRALVHNAAGHGGLVPGSPPWALAWLLEELTRLRAVELAVPAPCTHPAELARLREVLASRTPDRVQWEHAAQLLHRWVSDIRWCSASESARIKSRTRVAQIGVELGLVDL